MDDLKKKTLQGLLYLGMGKGAGKLISFATTLVLARLLAPQDYGLMALVMVVVGFLEFFNEIGLGSAIKQRPEITPAQLNGSFTLSLLISTTLFGLLVLAAPTVAAYYDNAALAPVMRVVALSFIIGALATVSDALLARAMQFKLVAAVEFVMIVLQSGTTLLLAWLGHGVWALAWGFIVAQAFKAACLIALARWRPSRLGDIAAALDLIRFGLTVTYSRLTWFLYSNAQTLIIGKTLNAQALGVYAMAESLASLPTGHVTGMVIRVASPLFAKLQHDLQRLNNALLRMTTGLALINYPVMVGMACTASELVPVVLGPQWLQATLPLQVLCLVGLVKTVDPLLTQALTSTGQVRLTARYTTLCAVTVPSGVLLGSLWGGLPGAALGIAVAYPLSAIYLFRTVKRHVHLSLGAYLRAVRMPLEASAWMAAWVLGVAWALRAAGVQQDAVLLTVKVLTGMLAYAVFLIYVRRDGLRDAHEVLCELGVPASRLQRWPFTLLSEGHAP
ncbi:lipopolysaccharide biosynthesis protein [Hydrogenophaga sp.]|uniref:lipopolysaccharide biosynthesis protein n=1 Tax=Hydrogenophaga sp. TaxID=1904254 RepID=UPI00286DB409|nr:lipopolysaccharide biosynthesis protein [Hydrogenophaga sp.]